MFKSLFSLLLCISVSYATCVPVVQQEVQVISENKVYLCDNPFEITNITVYQNQHTLFNSTNQTCQDCEFLVHLIQHQMGMANKTIEDIITLIKDVCQNLHSPSGKECLIIIDDVQQIINWIVDGLSFQQICQKLGLCSLQKETQYFVRNSRVNY